MDNFKVVKTFAELIEKLTYKGKGMRGVPLTNFTFFLGAGFSKAWDVNYPLGTQLFDFNGVGFRRGFESLGAFVEQCGFDPHGAINFEIFSECYYKLGMLKKYPEIRPRYIDEQTLKIIEAEFKALIWEALDQRVNLNYLKEERVCFDKTNKNQNQIIRIIANLMEQCDGSKGLPEGIRVNFLTTNYDYIVEGIIDEYLAYLGDYHYIHSYRGFTPHLINGDRNINPLHDHFLVHNIIKINGGLEIRYQNNTFNIDHRKHDLKTIIENPPEIILPSKEQDYTNNYFRSIFSKTTRMLQESRVLIIVGYSFPKEDALLRFILRHFAEDFRDMTNKYIFYIDIGDKDQLKEKVYTICPRDRRARDRVYVFNKGFVRFAKLLNRLGMP